jgi:hypothetical protein
MAMTLRDELLRLMVAAGPYEVTHDPEGWTDDGSYPCPSCHIDMWSTRPGGQVACGYCGMVDG